MKRKLPPARLIKAAAWRERQAQQQAATPVLTPARVAASTKQTVAGWREEHRAARPTGRAAFDALFASVPGEH